MKKSNFPDEFQKARQNDGVNQMDDQDDPVIMILGHKDVRKCAHDFKTFQSGAIPGRIVVPSEVHIRDVRQIPFEVDPPDHKEYRTQLETWFRRPLTKEYEEQLFTLINRMIDELFESQNVEVVHDFALPLQSIALTYLLKVPQEEANHFISWGTHVFRSEDNPLDNKKANVLYDYLDEQINYYTQNPGDDIYSKLLEMNFQDRPLTTEEIKGILILTFAGGRDTVINAVTNTIAYLAEHPEEMIRLREKPEIISRAVEELMRYFSPLTHMGRVATQDTSVCNHAVKKDSRISLCWASANRDEKVFENPNEVRLDRKINPHVAFGFSHHKCLGAHHSRQILKTLLKVVANKVERIEIIDHQDKIEKWGSINKKVGFNKLNVIFSSLN